MVLAHGQHLAPVSPAVSPAGAGAALALIAAATVLGSLLGFWLGRRDGGRPAIAAACVSGVLLVVAVAHVLPDALAAAERADLAGWPVVALGAVSYLAFGRPRRSGLGGGCACQLGEVRGWGAAGGLALHRAIEGTALVAAGSAAVLLAITTHAVGEGLALGGILGGRPRRLLAWTVLAATSPVLGVAVARTAALPEPAVSLLLAVVAGVLTRSAQLALEAALRHRSPDDGSAARGVLAAATLSGALTAVAVAASG